MKFQIGDYVTPVSNYKSNLNGGIEKFRGHVGRIVSYDPGFQKYQVDFVDDMIGIEDRLHSCDGAIPGWTGQNISACDLELIARDECGDSADLLGIDDAVEALI